MNFFLHCCNEKFRIKRGYIIISLPRIKKIKLVTTSEITKIKTILLARALERMQITNVHNTASNKIVKSIFFNFIQQFHSIYKFFHEN